MTGYTAADKFKYWLFQDKIPLTKVLMLVNVITYLAIAIGKLEAIKIYLGFVSVDVFLRPWTFLTYPFVGTCCPLWGPLSLVFSLFWLWVVGGSLERGWGTLKFGLFFFVMSGISAVSFLLAAMILQGATLLQGLMVPLAGLTVAFAMRNPEEQIMFNFLIPLKLKYLALLDVVLLFVSYASENILLGVFSLAGCAYAYWYIRRPSLNVAPRRQPRGEVVRVFEKRSPARRLNPFAAIKEWNEKKKLKDLFERSFGDDEHDERGRR